MLLIDVITGLIGVLIFAFVKVATHEKALSKVKTKTFDDLKEGFRFAWNTPFVRGYFGIICIYMLILPIPSTLNILLITRVFGEDTIYLTLNEIAYFTGGGIGGFIFAKWGGFKNRVKSWILGFMIFGATTIGIGITNIFWLYIVIIAICGLSMPLCNAVPMTMLQENIKDENILGRVFSLNNIIATVSIPFGIAIYGPLADIVDIRIMTVVSGVGLILVGIITRFTKSVYMSADADNSE